MQQGRVSVFNFFIVASAPISPQKKKKKKKKLNKRYFCEHGTRYRLRKIEESLKVTLRYLLKLLKWYLLVLIVFRNMIKKSDNTAEAFGVNMGHIF